ncbi:MAG: 23S rRNA (pseudouridine(1915)-N(3))-methyltransferase RlmH [Porticoccaceae bacterium]
MRIRVIAVGGKMPDWVSTPVKEYSRRLPRELALEWIEVPLGKRHKGGGSAQAIAEESKALLRAVAERDTVIALDVRGKAWTTEQLAGELAGWQASGDHYSILIGGPDGLSDDCYQRARLRWSLSPLTLPHPLVRVLLAEQLYRAWSINAGHPYHK